MKKFKVQYMPSLGSYLDEKDIKWESLAGDVIYIYCKDANELFAIAYGYAEFMTEIEADN